ncbi:uncharacterized protein KY384_001446 [Bacidia gigantensis]|uniref:uncharacterized protein n=1 Tax=Bacidia gigantensis TaxID=2732470 RepID=UPI001D04AA33|nr:uncharacterized protein KY384_001446 [Bacidia gigantensis]KAG8533705.1 hypothetical protein KY384_001446 [Bacidia gigantensis]
MHRPSKRAQSTLFNLISSTESMVADEAEFIRHSPDLASIIPSAEGGWFSNFLEDTLNQISRRATKFIFRSKEQALQTGDEELQLVDSRRLDILLRLVLTILASTLLLVPVFILFELQPSHTSEFAIYIYQSETTGRNTSNVVVATNGLLNQPTT